MGGRTTTPNTFFNVNAFAEPVAGTAADFCTYLNFGDAPRYSFRGPGVNDRNISLFKNFTVKERFVFQLRAEAYNAFNPTQFSTINANIRFNAAGQNANAQFGHATAARDPRIMQFALRLRF